MVLDLVQKLPEDTTLEQIYRELSFVAGLREAELQADRGQLIDHETGGCLIQRLRDLGLGILILGPPSRFPGSAWSSEIGLLLRAVAPGAIHGDNGSAYEGCFDAGLLVSPEGP